MQRKLEEAKIVLKKVNKGCCLAQLSEL